MWKRTLIAVLVLVAFAGSAFAQDTPTPANTATITRTPTVTSTPTRTPTLTPTRTINPALTPAGQKVTGTDRLTKIIQAAPGAQAGNLAEILGLAARVIKIKATNATALGRTDIVRVKTILAFTTSTGAPATQTLLVEGTDYTVANGDVTPVGDHSAETWVIAYTP